MGLDHKSIGFEGPVMSYFMDICDQELIRVKVVVDGYFLDLSIHLVPEISQFAATAFGKDKMKWIFMPQIPTILNCIWWNLLF